MINIEFIKCKICGYDKAKTNNGFCNHLYSMHKIRIEDYIKIFLPIPRCEICGSQFAEMPKRPLRYYARNGRFYKQTCSSPKCISKFFSKVQSKLWNEDKPELKDAARERRVTYLKKHTRTNCI